MCISRVQPNTRPVASAKTAISDFETYERAMIHMLMVVTESGWSNIVYDYGDKFGSLLNSSIFYHSCILLVKFVILPLLTGLIWEIFTIVSGNYKDKQRPGETAPSAKKASSSSGLPIIPKSTVIMGQSSMMQSGVSEVDGGEKALLRNMLASPPPQKGKRAFKQLNVENKLSEVEEEEEAENDMTIVDF